MIDDMEAVVAAARLKRFALYGISQGAAFSVRYAYEHPDEVSCLIFFGGFARGRLHRNNEHEQSYQLAANTLIEQGWGSPNPMFRNFFTDAFFPDAPKEVKDSFDEMQRMSCSPERALQISMMNADVNVSEMATKLDVPTLVINNKDDGVCPVTEGRTLARLIPRATFIEFPGNEHILREGPPYFDQFFEEVSEFLAEHN
jgi:pimeloyl-ACP methyl ester carboxylesterase